MLAEALEAEVADYIARNQERDEHGRAQVVRNGKARPRKVTLGSGTVEVQAPRVDDRRETEDGSHYRFRSQLRLFRRTTCVTLTVLSCRRLFSVILIWERKGADS